MPLHREPDYQIFEYACHEGNRAVPNTLSAGRARDKAARPPGRSNPRGGSMQNWLKGALIALVSVAVDARDRRR